MLLSPQISWTNEVIEVGRGVTLGTDRLVYAEDSRADKRVAAIALSSNQGARAAWQLKAINSEQLT
jgi:hypothetical protein